MAQGMIVLATTLLVSFLGCESGPTVRLVLSAPNRTVSAVLPVPPTRRRNTAILKQPAGTPSTPQTSTKQLPSSTTRPASTESGKSSSEAEYIGQFESAITESQAAFIMGRSNAQDNATLHIDSSDVGVEFHITICAKPVSKEPVLFRAGSLYYSNDGPSDNVTLVLDNELIARATTLEQYRSGAAWNEFIEVQFHEGNVSLSAGNHTVVVTAQTDQWGVELDAVSFVAINQDPGVLLLCDGKLVVPGTT